MSAHADSLVVVESEAGQCGGELLEHDAGFEASQRCTEAEVGPGAEGQVLVGVGPPEVELVRTIEHRRIALGRAMQTRMSAPAGSSTPPSVAAVVVRRRQCTTDES